MQGTFIAQLFARLGSKSPRFFRIFQVVSIVMVCIAAVAYWLLKKEVLPVPVDLSDKLQDICREIGVFFGGTLLASGSGTTNPELMDDHTKERVIEHVAGDNQ